MPSRAELKAQNKARGQLPQTISAAALDIPKVKGGGQPLEIASSSIQADPDQPRKEAGDFSHEALSGLAQSIAEHGLLQPIIVWQDDNGDYHLVAGERRLRAVRDHLERETIPALVLDAPPQNKRAVQIIENRQRRALSDYDYATALLEEFEEKLAARDEARRADPELPRYTQRELATSLGEDETDVSRHLQVARWLRANPDHPLTGPFQRGEVAFDRVLEVVREASREAGETRGRGKAQPAERADGANSTREAPARSTAGSYPSFAEEQAELGRRHGSQAVSEDDDDEQPRTQRPGLNGRNGTTPASDRFDFRGTPISYAEATAILRDLRRSLPRPALSAANPNEVEGFVAEAMQLVAQLEGYSQ